VSSSGIPAFDAAALSVVRHAAPFGPLPEALEISSLPLSVTLEYTLR
jgi:TonB family protein